MSSTMPLPRRIGVISALLLGAVVGYQPVRGQQETPAADTASSGGRDEELGRVTVFEAETGTPIENAKVRWFVLPSSPPPPITISRFCDEDVSADLEYEVGWLDERANGSPVAYTDSTGTALIPLRANGFTRIVGRNGSLWGTAMSWRGHEKTRLELYPNFDLPVRVVDESGVPVPGVHVAIRKDMSKGVRYNSLEAETASPTGIATFRNAGFMLAGGVTNENEAGAVHWLVAIDECLAANVEEPIDPTRTFGEPITLVMPETGQVEVLLREADGSLAKGRIPIFLHEWTRWTTEDSRHHPDLEIATPFGATRAEAVDGTALLQNIGLDMQLGVRVRRNCASRTIVETTSGPNRSDRRMTIEVGLTTDAIALSGRLIDESGIALANRKLVAELLSGPPRTQTRINLSPDGYVQSRIGSVMTDGLGFVRMEFETEAALWGHPWLVLSCYADAHDALARRFDLRENWSLGSHDLGVLILPPAPLLAAGRVVDDQGVPLEGVDMSIHRFAEGIWARTLGDGQGSFALRGVVPDPTIAVDAQKDGYVIECARSVAVGTSDLRFVMRREARIKGRVLLAEGMHVSDVKLILLQGYDRGSATGEQDLEDDGSFKIERLRPESHRLVLRRLDGSRIVQQEIVPKPGETLEVVLDARGSTKEP